jgi:DNA-binding NarL/FixJ family response regulator
MKKQRVKTVLVDDHPLLLSGVAALLQEDPAIEIVGQVNKGGDLLSVLKLTETDVVVLDVSMPKHDGFFLFDQIKLHFPKIKVVIFTMHNLRRYFRSFYEKGVDGYVLKSGDLGQLSLAIHTAANGGRYFDLELVHRMHDLLPEASEEEHQVQLTKLEVQLVGLLAKGLTSTDLEKTLQLKMHELLELRKQVLLKTGVQTTVDLLALAKRRNWI